MRKINIKYLLIFFVFIILFWFGYRREIQKYEVVTEKPVDFPSCLKVIDGACRVRYYNNSDVARGVRFVKYYLKYDYPAKDVVRQLEEHFKREGFVFLENQLVYPTVPNQLSWKEDSKLEKVRSTRLMEYWIDSKKNCLSLYLQYQLPLNEGSNGSELMISLALCDKKSVLRKFVDRYIEVNSTKEN